MTGVRRLDAPVPVVWSALNDPMVIEACAPGCEAMEPIGENAYRVAVAQQIGPVSARFAGTILLLDIDPGNAYTLRFDGQGAAGFVKGEARVTLAPAGPEATDLSYAANAQVGGKLAQIGSRLIDGVAARLTGEFFDRFMAAVAAPQAVSAEPPIAASPEPEPIEPDPITSSPVARTTRMRFVVIAGLVTLVVVATWIGLRGR